MRITQSHTYHQAPGVVWRALTDRDAIRQWWLDTNFEPVVGREVWFQDTAQGSWDGRSTGRVLEVDPPRLVRFEWNGGGQKMIVTYALRPEGTGTHLTVTQEGLRGVSGFVLALFLRSGWRGYLRGQLPAIAAHLHDHVDLAAYPVPPKAERAR